MVTQLYYTYKTLSPTLRVTLWTITLLLLSGVLFLPLYLSRIAELRSIQSQINEVEGNVVRGKQLEARCTLPTEDEEKVWRDMRKTFSKRVPAEKKLLPLVKDIAKIAHDCSIYDISFSMPQSEGEDRCMNRQNSLHPIMDTFSNTGHGAIAAPISQGHDGGGISLKRVSLHTSFHCRYRDLANFLKGVSNLLRLLEVESLTIERKLPLIAVEMVIIAFYSEVSENA